MERTYTSETPQQVGQKVTVCGWIHARRDHGKIVFLDVRDRDGLLQVVVTNPALDLHPEDVVAVTGTIKTRPEKMVNPNIATGHVEMEASGIEVLAHTKTLPFDITEDTQKVEEQVRLRYRYLDLRSERMHNIMLLRSNYYAALREALYARRFVEIETPMLTKSTKEGARDFIVPSRFYPGKFYALPQSPQQYKQLLMTAGIERYFQFARCIRDEDLRADRGFEFTQLDLEMSFVDEYDVMKTVEEIVKIAIPKVGGKLRPGDFPVYEYQEAIKRFGADKFDFRSVKEKKEGILGFAWVIHFPFFKQVDVKDAAEVRDSKSGWTFTHNPFSKPIKEHEEWLLKRKNIDKIMTTQYDLVCNGYEIAGGSIRAHNPEMLRSTFAIMGYNDKEIEKSVGHMLEAFEMGTPPHGGIAFGLDRHIMLMAGETSLKETIAFPMTSTGRTSVMDAPTDVMPDQLKELGISVNEPKSSRRS